MFFASHKTELSTVLRIRIQLRNTSGVILKELLNEEKTKLFFGNFKSKRVNFILDFFRFVLNGK